MIFNAIPTGLVNLGKRTVSGILTISRDVQWMCAHVYASLTLHITALLQDSTCRISPIIRLFALAASVISFQLISVINCLCHVSWLPCICRKQQIPHPVSVFLKSATWLHLAFNQFVKGTPLCPHHQRVSEQRSSRSQHLSCR